MACLVDASLKIRLFEVSLGPSTGLHLRFYEEIATIIRSELARNNIGFFAVKSDVSSGYRNPVLVD